MGPGEAMEMSARVVMGATIAAFARKKSQNPTMPRQSLERLRIPFGGEM